MTPADMMAVGVSMIEQELTEEELLLVLLVAGATALTKRIEIANNDLDLGFSISSSVDAVFVASL